MATKRASKSPATRKGTKQTGGKVTTKTKYALRCGQRLRDARAMRGWTQLELSTRTRGRLSRSRIANYEQGLCEIGIYEAEVLASTLRVAPAYLMGFVSSPNA